MSIATLMNQTVTIERNTPTADRLGGNTESWVSHKASVPIRIQPLSALERQQYDRSLGLVTHRGYMPDFTDITTRDRVTATHPQTGNSVTYLIRGVRMTDQDGRLQVLELEEQQ